MHPKSALMHQKRMPVFGEIGHTVVLQGVFHNENHERIGLRAMS